MQNLNWIMLYIIHLKNQYFTICPFNFKYIRIDLQVEVNLMIMWNYPLEYFLAHILFLVLHSQASLTLTEHLILTF